MNLKHVSEITGTVIAGIASVHLALKSAQKLREGDAASAEMYADLAGDALGDSSADFKDGYKLGMEDANRDFIAGTFPATGPMGKFL